MIRPDGTIHFAEELLVLVERFIEDYQDIEGDLTSDLDRGLVAAYALSALHCDIEILSECLSKQPLFRPLSPTRVLDECSDRNSEKRSARLAEAAQLLEHRAWLRPD